jgi:hypothetical protein
MDSLRVTFQHGRVLLAYNRLFLEALCLRVALHAAGSCVGDILLKYTDWFAVWNVAFLMFSF